MIEIGIAISMLLTNVPATVSSEKPHPPCKDGALNCKPWDRDWYGAGPFNLVIRWGAGGPVVVRYDNLTRCEAAALAVVVQGDVIADEMDGRPIPDILKGGSAPFAFCIPG